MFTRVISWTLPTMKLVKEEEFTCTHFPIYKHDSKSHPHSSVPSPQFLYIGYTCQQHRGRWGSKVACNLSLRNVKAEIHLSSFTFLRMWTMAICANLKYSREKCMKTRDASIVFQIWVNGFKSKGGSMVALKFFFIHNLNIPCYASSPQRSNNDATNELEPPNPISFGS